MRVLVVGAYGLIGSYVVARLHADGHAVTGAGRDIDMAKRRFPFARWINADLGRLRMPEDWREHLSGIDAVVNCAGALQESSRDDLSAVHVDGPLALYQACATAGIRRVIHLSAASVGAGRATRFNDTKHLMEERLKSLDLEWIILRPGLVLAPAAYGGTALLRGLAAFPFIVPTIHAGQPTQIVSVHDVAAAVARALEPSVAPRVSIDLVNARPTTLGEVLASLRGWLGLKPAPVVELPEFVAGITAGIGDLIAALGWRSPMRSTTVAQLRMGVRGDGLACERALGFRPSSLSDLLAREPSGVQERWFARLYFIKPLALATLALFWLLSGLIGLANHAAAAGVLTAVGCPAGIAMTAVLAGSVVDVALGVLVAFRRSAPPALIGMVLVSAVYLLGGTFLRPDLWADPLGPLLKVVPGMMLALATLAMMDER